MESTTHFGLHSQTTRLSEGSGSPGRRRRSRGSHPLRRAFPGRLRRRQPGTTAASPGHNSPTPGAGDFRLELFPLRSPLL